MAEKISKWLYWTPRVLSILLICFIFMFSFDVFSPEYSYWQILGAFLMHNIPVFILIAVLIISWRYEIVGGIGVIAAGLLYIILLGMSSNFEWNMLAWSFIISGPAFLTGVLFLLNWRKRKK